MAEATDWLASSRWRCGSRDEVVALGRGRVRGGTLQRDSSRFVELAKKRSIYELSETVSV
jgi:hypothetical protein